MDFVFTVDPTSSTRDIHVLVLSCLYLYTLVSFGANRFMGLIVWFSLDHALECSVDMQKGLGTY